MGACRHPHFLRRNNDADVVNSRGDRFLGMTAAMTQIPVPTANTKGTVPIVRLKAREKNRLKFCRIEEKSVSLHRK